MNNARRTQLESISLKLDDIITEEQESFDNLPESLQYSEKGETMETYIEQMEEAKALIEDCAGI